MNFYGHRSHHRPRPEYTRNQRICTSVRALQVVSDDSWCPDVVPGDEPSGLVPDGPPLRVAVHHLPGVVVLRPAGDIDVTTTPLLSRVLGAVLAQQPALVVVDLTPTTFLSCAGLTALIGAQRLAGDRTRLTVIAPTRATQRPLRLTGAHRVLSVYLSLADSLADRNPGERHP